MGIGPPSPPPRLNGPSPAAWAHFGRLAVAALTRLAEEEARAAADEQEPDR